MADGTDYMDAAFAEAEAAGARGEVPVGAVMVIGGECDAVFPPFATSYTALRWRARETCIPDCGHMLMLEHQWRAAADALARWLQTTVRRHSPARSSGSVAEA